MNSTTKTIIYIIIALIIIYVGYSLLKSGPVEEPTLAEPLTIELLSVEDSNQNGEVLIEEEFIGEEEVVKQLKITLSLTEIPVENEETEEPEEEEEDEEETEETEMPEIQPQVASIHMGSCQELGELVYQLSDIQDNTSETILDVDMEQLLSQLPLAINAPDIACGEINDPSILPS